MVPAGNKAKRLSLINHSAKNNSTLSSGIFVLVLMVSDEENRGKSLMT